MPEYDLRNTQYNADGTTIDAEANHPVYGWIPITLNPNDTETAAMHATALAAGPAAYVAPAVTASQVNAERERRILLPKTVTVTGAGTFPVDMDGGGRANVSDLSQAAMAKQSIGDTSTFSFRDANDTDHTLTNEQMIELALSVMAQISAIHASAKTIKALDPIPQDYDADARWP